ncbi:MAG: PIG-L family deacetylase, partial [Gemmatimonadota bacterium]
MRSSLRPWRRAATLAALATLPWRLSAQAPSVPPDPRFKVDILLIVAHPDDESAVSSYLAQAIFDQGKRVAVVYGTRGDGGGNTAGPEQAAALGAVREIEARQALATLGIDRVWFLDGRDTPSQDVLQSLETWHHGAALEQAVRLVRLTRPDVVMTWLPQFVIGENHGDHQAAGVIATEAFDLAGDPTAFPSQVAPARNRTSIGNLTEGLTAWQPKKLYYFSDRADVTAFRSHGPAYPSTTLSSSKKVPYYQLTARLLAYHRTQGEEARIADDAVKSGDYNGFL